jgi:hypothetical protein
LINRPDTSYVLGCDTLNTINTVGYFILAPLQLIIASSTAMHPDLLAAQNHFREFGLQVLLPETSYHASLKMHSDMSLDPNRGRVAIIGGESSGIVAAKYIAIKLRS